MASRIEFRGRYPHRTLTFALILETPPRHSWHCGGVLFRQIMVAGSDEGRACRGLRPLSQAHPQNGNSNACDENDRLQAGATIRSERVDRAFATNRRSARAVFGSERGSENSTKSQHDEWLRSLQAMNNWRTVALPDG